MNQTMIDTVFAVSENQTEVLFRLYLVAMGRIAPDAPKELVDEEWDKLISIDGYPEVSEKTSKYIFQKAIAFDQKHHPDVFAGGFWMNRGFSTGDVPDWTVNFSNVVIA
ncbi:MAG: hypothetical protein PHQ43_11610 [Dehalococcoidales bacterium]|nr:hypothetical protein [Dehalococcoidales bacterium]